MPRELARGKAEAFKNLKLDSDFFGRMLSRCEDGPEDTRDFDVYLMEKSVMPLLLQGLDALSRHVDKITTKGASPTDGRSNFNPLVWLAQYLLRNHPRYVKDHRTPMYERFSELAGVERGRRCLLRRREEIQVVWHGMIEENGGTSLTLDDISTVFQRLDFKWYLDGALLERLPQDFSKVDIEKSCKDDGAGKDEVCFVDFWVWFEDFVKRSDVIRASAFLDAERRQFETEQKAKKAQEDAAQRERVLKEALEQRSELEEQFENITADMYVSSDVSRIMNKGAVIEGVEEKEGGPPLQGEHITLIRLMLAVWGCPVDDDTNGDIWNDSALAAWQMWVQARGFEISRGVDKQTLRRLIDKDEFEAYLQLTYPVRDDDADDDYQKQVVEVRCFLDDDVDIVVEAVDEDTGELLHLILPDHETESLRQRLATATETMPVLAMADRVSGRIISLMPQFNSEQNH